MPKGSKNSANSASITVINIGHLPAVPMKTTVTIKEGKGAYKTKSRISYGDKPEGSKSSSKFSSKTKSRICCCDKQSGSYRQETTKKKASAGTFQLKNGTTGTKSECKKSSTIRFGDKNGYTEVYNEQRVRQVSYNKSSGSKNLITYDFGDGGAYDGSDGGGMVAVAIAVSLVGVVDI